MGDAYGQNAYRQESGISAGYSDYTSTAGYTLSGGGQQAPYNDTVNVNNGKK